MKTLFFSDYLGSCFRSCSSVSTASAPCTHGQISRHSQQICVQSFVEAPNNLGIVEEIEKYCLQVNRKDSTQWSVPVL